MSGAVTSKQNCTVITKSGKILNLCYKYNPTWVLLRRFHVIFELTYSFLSGSSAASTTVVMCLSKVATLSVLASLVFEGK